MGLFGGSKQRTEQNTSLVDYATNNSAGGDVGGNYAPNTINGNGNTIETTDFGAIEAGRSLASQALESGASVFESFANNITDTAGMVVDKSLGIAAKNQVSEAAQMQQTWVRLALVAGAVIAAVLIFKGR